MFTIGIGINKFPVGCRYLAKDLPAACAAALVTASETASVALAPRVW